MNYLSVLWIILQGGGQTAPQEVKLKSIEILNWFWELTRRFSKRKDPAGKVHVYEKQDFNLWTIIDLEICGITSVVRSRAESDKRRRIGKSITTGQILNVAVQTQKISTVDWNMLLSSTTKACTTRLETNNVTPASMNLVHNKTCMSNEAERYEVACSVPSTRALIYPQSSRLCSLLLRQVPLCVEDTKRIYGPLCHVSNSNWVLFYRISQ